MEDLDTFLQFHPKASRLTKPVTLTNINESFNLSSDEEETLPHRAASESSKTTINDSKLSKKSSKMCHGDDSIASHHDQTASRLKRIALESLSERVNWLKDDSGFLEAGWNEILNENNPSKS